MQVYVVVEYFLGGKTIPDIKGVYQDKAKAEEIKDNYPHAFIEEQHLIQLPEEYEQTEVYVVMELLKFNVPNVVGVFKNEAHTKEIVSGCKYEAIVVETKLI